MHVRLSGHKGDNGCSSGGEEDDLGVGRRCHVLDFYLVETIWEDTERRDISGLSGVQIVVGDSNRFRFRLRSNPQRRLDLSNKFTTPADCSLAKSRIETKKAKQYL